MAEKKRFTHFLEDGVSFRSEEAAESRYLYFPLCGSHADSLKSSITPFLSGDIKINKHCFVTKPFSREDLRTPVRNFFVRTEEGEVFSFFDSEGGAKGHVEAGMLWHKRVVETGKKGLTMEAVNFVDVDETVELMRVSVTNSSKKPVTLVPTAVVPLFGRALDNKHDHEHVTSLLNRVEQWKEGVFVRPVMIFDERGHKKNQNCFFVFGFDGQGHSPAGTFPTIESFLGDSSILTNPRAVIENTDPKKLSDNDLNGKEAVGALRFKKVTLKPGESGEYVLLIGTAPSREQTEEICSAFGSLDKVEEGLTKNRQYWSDKVRSIEFITGDKEFDSWMKWVTLQPVLRRIYGCSFLPDHDYGKGGKGWRDIWQDLLSLIFIEPEHVRQHLVNNFAGVRIDGSNATIIGETPGEFIADRNAITRIWMDHGVWPFFTILFYVHMTGDSDIFLEETTYFRDQQLSRTKRKDFEWDDHTGNMLLDKNQEPYFGTVLEHILVEHLTQFFNVGEHNIVRLENADWNDGLDMGFERGESAAFASFFCGNLGRLADTLEFLKDKKGIKEVSFAQEIFCLLDSIGASPVNYDSVEDKQKHLFEVYCPGVEPSVSGEKKPVTVDDLIKDLRKKRDWMAAHLRSQERVEAEGESWFNGYYDNKGKRVEGKAGDTVRMTLTGCVFPLLGGVADDAQCREVARAVDRFLWDKRLKGYRLNTDFGLDHYMELGRAFGFAYGTKENGSFFSHMNVMYAYALYSRGMIKEGHKVLDSLFKMSTDSQASRIYPGVPEYFDSNGRGFYCYLTGSASWLVLTCLTEVYGIKGHCGDLLLEPKLVPDQFDRDGHASVVCGFAGKKLRVRYENKKRLPFGTYRIQEVEINGQLVKEKEKEGNGFLVERAKVRETKEDLCEIRVVLGG